jgi:hypothetical protein
MRRQRESRARPAQPRLHESATAGHRPSAVLVRCGKGGGSRPRSCASVNARAGRPERRRPKWAAANGPVVPVRPTLPRSVDSGDCFGRHP